MNRFDAAIFDMDGLLLDTEKIARRTFLETCHEFGLGEEIGLFNRLIGTNQKLGKTLLARGLNHRADAILFGTAWDDRYHQETTLKPIPVKAGAFELLNRLSSLGIPAAVATSTDSGPAGKKLVHAGLRNYFSLIVGGDEVSAGKPDPEIYITAVERLGVAAGRALALEDSENGVISAHTAGLTVIQIPDLVEPSAALRRLEHTILSSLEEVVARV